MCRSNFALAGALSPSTRSFAPHLARYLTPAPAPRRVALDETTLAAARARLDVDVDGTRDGARASETPAPPDAALTGRAAREAKAGRRRCPGPKIGDAALDGAAPEPCGISIAHLRGRAVRCTRCAATAGNRKKRLALRRRAEAVARGEPVAPYGRPRKTPAASPASAAGGAA